MSTKSDNEAKSISKKIQGRMQALFPDIIDLFARLIAIA